MEYHFDDFTKLKFGEHLMSRQLGECEVIDINYNSLFPIHARSIKHPWMRDGYMVNGLNQVCDTESSLARIN